MTTAHKRHHLLALAAALAMLGGCATYQEARSNVAPGGALDQQKAAARQDLSNAQSENARLGNEKARREADLKRNDERLRQVDQKRHAELKREMDALRGEAQSVDLQNKGDAFKPADASADAAKEQRLRELERRKKDLETALAALAAGK